VRIALVIPGGVDRSGIERVIPALLSLIERLSSRHDVHVFALRQEAEPGTWRLRGAMIHDLAMPQSGLPGSGVLRFAPRLAALLSKTGPFDLVHAFWANTPAFLAAVAAGLHRLPLAVHLAGGELTAIPEIGYGGWLFARERLKTRFALSRAVRVTAGSRFLKGLAASRGISADVVPLGVDTSLFSPAPRPESSGFSLLHVASLNRVKDQPTLLRAFRRVVDAEPRATLEIAGEDTLCGAVQAETGWLGLSAHVTFHGVLKAPELVALFRRADLFVQSSRHEAQGVAVLEAASCGVPTVGTAVGLVSDLAPDGAAAVPVGDDAALSTAILDLLRNEERRHRMGTAARAFALANDADATTRAFEEIYREIASR
jgi:glycosyltransferase involved in cell wall biosynthesis